MVSLQSMAFEPPLRQKYDYTALVDYMEQALGGRRRQITLDENYTKIVTLSSLAAGATGPIVDIRIPAGQKMTVMGTQQIPAGADARTAHSLRLRFRDTGDVELQFDSTVRMTKEGITDDVDNLFRVYYGDVSLTKNPGLITTATSTLKTDLEWYRFKQGIIFDGEEHEIIAVLAADRAVDSAHVSFKQDSDIWYF